MDIGTHISGIRQSEEPTQPSSTRRSILKSWSELDIVTRYALLLVGIWLARLGLLGLLQVTTNTGMGLKVWPVGEDQNWMCLIRDKPGLTLPRTFWTLDNRNPLSVWWYVAAKPLILEPSGYGFFIVRRIMDLACALCVLLLINRLSRGRHGFFAFSCALLTLLWNINWRMDDVIWVFLGALCFSLLSLWAYCKYADSDRTQGHYMALSLVFYLLAIGTYTLQASAFMPVVVFGIFRPPGRAINSRAWLTRILRAAGDVTLFALVFGIFMLVWITCSSPWLNMEACSPGLARTQLWQSLKEVIWHPGRGFLIRSVASSWPVSRVVAVGLGGIVFFTLLLGRIAFGRAWRAGSDVEIGGNAENSSSLAALLAYTVSVIGGISALTIAVESTSPIWYPGTRTQMTEQVLQPLLYGCALLGMACAVSKIRNAAQIVLWVGASTVSAAVLLLGLEYNRLQVMTTSILKRRIAEAVRQLDPYVDQPVNIILKMDPLPERCYDVAIAQRYLQRRYRSKLLNVIVLQKRSPVAAWMGLAAVALRPDEQGILTTGSCGKPGVIGYDRVVFAEYHNGRTRLLDKLGPADVDGYEVQFARDGPIRAADLPLMRTFAQRLQGATR